jgi:hypothetical protein
VIDLSGGLVIMIHQTTPTMSARKDEAMSICRRFLETKAHLLAQKGTTIRLTMTSAIRDCDSSLSHR